MPPANPPTATAAATPTTVAIGSAEFNEAVAAAVALALAGSAVPMPRPTEASTIGVPQPVVIQPTSIDLTAPGLDDLTVRFRRFCTFQNCGYQRGQEAGFPRKAAEELQAAGAAFIVYDPRHAARAA